MAMSHDGSVALSPSPSGWVGVTTDRGHGFHVYVFFWMTIQITLTISSDGGGVLVVCLFLLGSGFPA